LPYWPKLSALPVAHLIFLQLRKLVLPVVNCRRSVSALSESTTYLSRRDFATTSLATGTLLANPAWAAPGDAKTEARIRELIARMIIVEKAIQLTIMSTAFKLPNEIEANARSPVARADEAREIEAGRMGGIFDGFGASWAKGVQDAAMRSRLKIPLLIAADVIHGLNAVFPVPLAEAQARRSDDQAAQTIGRVSKSAAGTRRGQQYRVRSRCARPCRSDGRHRTSSANGDGDGPDRRERARFTVRHGRGYRMMHWSFGR